MRRRLDLWDGGSFEEGGEVREDVGFLGLVCE